jgi:hypothetical protein
MFEIVCDIDGDKNGTSQQGHQGEDSPHHAEKAEERCRIKADLVNELRLLCVNKGRYPAQYAGGYPWWLLVAYMVLDLGLIDNLGNRGLNSVGRKAGITHFIVRTKDIEGDNGDSLFDEKIRCSTGII